MDKEKNPLFIELQSLVKEGLEKALEGLSREERKKFFELNNGDLYDTLDTSLRRIAVDFLDSVNKQTAKGYKEDKGYEKDYKKRIEKIYKPYFVELYGLLSICLEAIHHHREYTSEQKAFRSKKHRMYYFLIVRLHARALRVCNEIVSLMEAGYGTGALSRWRALHELVTTINFLIENPNAIELFLEHNKVLSYEAMADYNKYSELLNHKPYSAREIAGTRRVRNNLVKKHGKEIKQPYGWLNIYSKGRLKNFRDLEKESGQEHLRPYYRYASYGIHTNVKSLFSGEDNSALKKDGILLVGASDSGMEEVAQLLPISIGFATTAILMGINHNTGSIITANAILLKQEQVAEAFMDIKLPDEDM